MIAPLLMRTSVVFLLIGMCAGVVMGITQSFNYASAHAHFNLLGGVLMFVAGLYYHVFKSAGADAMAKWQAGLHIAGAIVLPCGVAAIQAGGPSYEIVAIAGSLIMIAAMVLFVTLVFRYSRF